MSYRPANLSAPQTNVEARGPVSGRHTRFTQNEASKRKHAPLEAARSFPFRPRTHTCSHPAMFPLAVTEELLVLMLEPEFRR